MRELRDLDVVRSVGGLLRVIGADRALRLDPRRGARARLRRRAARRPRHRRRAVRARRMAGAADARARARPTPSAPRRSSAPFVGDDIAAPVLLQLCDEAYATFRHPAVVPLVQIDDDHLVQELFHGPTLAFKDVALQLVGRLFDHVLAQRAGGSRSSGPPAATPARRRSTASRHAPTSTSSSSTRTGGPATCSAGR